MTLTALSTALAVLMTPILTALLAGSRVDVAAGGLLLSTVQVVIAPVAAGALLKWRFPRAVDRVLPMAPLVAIAAISLIVGSVIGGGRERIIEAGPRLVLAVVSLHTLGFLLGYLAGRLALRREVRRGRWRSRSGCRTRGSAWCSPNRTSPTRWWRSQRHRQRLPFPGREPGRGVVAAPGGGAMNRTTRCPPAANRAGCMTDL